MVEERRLPSGLTLVAEQASWQQGVSLGLFVRGAVVDEPPGQEGIAHLLEHLVFRGTENYTGPALAAAIEDGGGELNAYTTKEYTCIWGRMLPDDLPHMLEVVAELFLRPLLRARDLRREVQVIEGEHALWLDSPEELVCDLLEEQIFGGSPLGRRVLGDPQALSALRAQDLRAFHQATWRLGRSVLAVSGPIPVAQVARLAQALEESPAPRAAARRVAARPAAGAASAGRISQIHLAVGGAALPFGDHGLAAQDLLVQEFGGGPSSRLFQRLRDEDALSYGVYSYATAYAAGGMWGVYADLPAGQLREGLSAILEEAQALRRARIGERRLGPMRRAAEGALLLSLDSPFARVERHALQVLLRGGAEPLDREIQELHAVDGRALREAAERMLRPETWHGVALLPDGRLLRGGIDELTAEVGE